MFGLDDAITGSTTEQVLSESRASARARRPRRVAIGVWYVLGAVEAVPYTF